MSHTSKSRALAIPPSTSNTSNEKDREAAIKFLSEISLSPTKPHTIPDRPKPKQGGFAGRTPKSTALFTDAPPASTPSPSSLPLTTPNPHLSASPPLPTPLVVPPSSSSATAEKDTLSPSLPPTATHQPDASSPTTPRAATPSLLAPSSQRSPPGSPAAPFGLGRPSSVPIPPDAENSLPPQVLPVAPAKACDPRRQVMRHFFRPQPASPPVSLYSFMPYVPREVLPRDPVVVSPVLPRHAALLHDAPKPAPSGASAAGVGLNPAGAAGGVGGVAAGNSGTGGVGTGGGAGNKSANNAAATQGGYDPFFLDDPTLTEGKHLTLYNFSSLRISFIPFVSKKDVTEEVNEKFGRRHPTIVKKLGLSLTRIRKLKRMMRRSLLQLDLPTSEILEPIARSYVLLEKLIILEAINSDCRKPMGAACVLISAKITLDACLSKRFLTQLIFYLSKGFRCPKEKIIIFEAQICSRNDLSLLTPSEEFNPHLEILQSLHATDMLY